MNVECLPGQTNVSRMSAVSRIYLDHNATTPLCSAARAAMMRVLDGEFGNPSSIHAEGRRARQVVEAARDQVAALVGGAAEEIVFTSGGTEADHLAMRLLGPEVVTSPLEHPAVLGAAGSARVRVDEEGNIDPASIPEGRPLSIQLANHEIGNIFPIADYKKSALFHCDAVQAAGKIAIDVRALGVDLLSISAHKIGGPKGVGALWVRRGVDLPPLHRGGHQERERRPGTENVAGIVGFGAAAEEARRLGHVDEVRRLRDRLESGALALGARRNGSAVRVGNTTNLAWEGVPGELLVAALDLEGVAVSTGAACTSGSVQPSPVLRALGQPAARAKEGVRFSLGPGNTVEEVDRVLLLLPALIARIRSA
jgi:cysteine desulfurase